MKRTTRQRCTACQGRGEFVEHRMAESDFFDTENEYYVTRSCPICAGLGYKSLELPDIVKCVCGQRFESVKALAAHRRTHP